MDDKPAEDLKALAERALKAATDKGVMLATAESCTGGMISATLSDIPGCSGALDRGFITYSNQAKTEMLGVSPETIEAHGAVSPEVAAEMAAGARDRAKVGLAVSVTGVAGPGGTENKPEGRVCFGIADERGTRTETVDFGPLGRDGVRRATTAHALRMMIEALG